MKTANVTGGLKCPPEMWPPAKIMTISTAPMASAGMTSAAAGITVQPTVSTRKNVPINSAIYFLILVFWTERWRSADVQKILYRNGLGWGSYFSARRILGLVRHSVLVIPRRL